MSWETACVHRMDGFVPAGSCGHGTTPRADEQRALQALATEHGQSAPRCALCGRDYEGRTWQQLRDDLQILANPGHGEVLACRDAPQACRDDAAQRQVHLDRAAFESFNAEPPRPRLHVVYNSDRR